MSDVGGVDGVISNTNANRIVRKRGGKLGEWEGFIVKGSYTVMHLAIYAVLAFRSGTDLNIAFKERDYFYLIWTHSIFITTFIVYYFAGSKLPGYSDDLPSNDNHSNINYNNNKSKLKKSDDQVVASQSSQLELHEYVKDISKQINSRQQDRDSDNSNDSNGNSNENEQLNESEMEMDRLLDNLTKSECKTKDDNSVDQPYCNICKRNVLIRSKHCKRCNQCILKYDHHCFFIGGCVGQYNHKAFCTFLFVQMILLMLGFKIALTGVHSAPTWKEWVLANLVMWFPTVITFAMMFMPIGLLAYNIYLVVTNQTSWEAQKYHRITYLRKCKAMKHPFSKGIKENIKLFWTANYGSPYWTLPSPSQQQKYLEEKKKKKQSLIYKLWKNDYYSCC